MLVIYDYLHPFTSSTYQRYHFEGECYHIKAFRLFSTFKTDCALQYLCLHFSKRSVTVGPSSPRDTYLGGGTQKYPQVYHALSLQLGYWKVETISVPANILFLPFPFHLCQPHASNVNPLKELVLYYRS